MPDRSVEQEHLRSRLSDPWTLKELYVWESWALGNKRTPWLTIPASVRGSVDELVRPQRTARPACGRAGRSRTRPSWIVPCRARASQLKP